MSRAAPRRKASEKDEPRRKSRRAGAKRIAKAAQSPDAAAVVQSPGGAWLEIIGARHNNLKDVDVRIPLGAFCVVTGVSGSGKSSLVDDVLYSSMARVLHRARTVPGAHDAIHGIEHINKVIRVDQHPLGNTPTSNPATYTGVFDLIRQMFAQLPESKLRGYTPRRFSFNVPGGRCEQCEGNGQIRVEMHFLPDVWVECDTCAGQRYNPEALSVRYHGHSIAEVLALSCGRAVKLFENIPKIRRILQTLCDVGLDYLTLGQAAPTLSGGEAQRVKLAAELARPDTGQTLYLLDEPTTGLHFEDLKKLLDVLNRLVDLGNTVVVIEHNLDVIKTADWIIDLGPEAGAAGGHVVATGSPEDLVSQVAAPTGNGKAGKSAASRSAAERRSYTAEMLAPVLEAGPYAKRPVHDFAARSSRREGDLEIREVGKEARMPWELDGPRWHTRDRVGRNGAPCRWDGRILARVVERIAELGDFNPVDWSRRTIVEITAPRKSDGWFLHAMTGEEWLLGLKFRVAKNSFRRETLVGRLDLKPLDDMTELPIYGRQPRVRCKNLRGPWQEISLRVHALAEIDRPRFWTFLEEAVAAFRKQTERRQQNPDDLMPWKVLGKKWHLARKGFPPGKKIDWSLEVLERLLALLERTAPDGNFDWHQQQVVHLRLAGSAEPWATVFTKRRGAVELILAGPKGAFTMGRVAQFGAEQAMSADQKGRDLLKMRFRKRSDLHERPLSEFLREHADRAASP